MLNIWNANQRATTGFQSSCSLCQRFGWVIKMLKYVTKNNVIKKVKWKSMAQLSVLIPISNLVQIAHQREIQNRGTFG